MNHKKIAQAAQKFYVDLDRSFSEFEDHQFAEHTYNALTLTMLTKICLGIAETSGQESFEHYWHDVTETMQEIVRKNACKTTKH
jgi:hypothetical protein